MADYKKKEIKKTHNPPNSAPKNTQSPDKINHTKPSWCFRTCDNELWNFNANEFTREILPKLKE